MMGGFLCGRGEVIASITITKNPVQ